MDLWVYEREAFDAGIKLVCGVDEAGRGPLAGPVCAAAVMLPPGLEIPGLNDSKKLTDKKRRELYDVITAQAVSYGIAFASEQEIDEINILQATFLAMERAMQTLSPQPQLALIDGNRAKDFGLPVRTIVKGDSLSASIAAASILAKVTRDRLMEEYDAQYPQYGFAVHKELGTFGYSVMKPKTRRRIAAQKRQDNHARKAKQGDREGKNGKRPEAPVRGQASRRNSSGRKKSHSPAKKIR